MNLVERSLRSSGMPDELVDRMLRAAEGARQTENQHYVPKAFLRGWADNERVGVWDTLEAKTFVASIDKICVVGDWLTLEHEGERLRDLEGLMALSDGALAQRIREVTSRSLPSDGLVRWEVALLLADLWSRGPQLRRLHDESATLMMRIMTQHEARAVGEDPAAWSLENHQNNHLKMATDAIVEAAQQWIGRAWTVFEAGNDVLATADTPVLLDQKGASYRPGAVLADRVYVALSPRHLMVLGPSGEGPSLDYKPLTSSVRNVYERLLVKSRERWIIGTVSWERTQREARIKKRWHSVVRCLGENKNDGSCLLNTSTVWAGAPSVEDCGRFGFERGHGVTVASLDQSGRPA